MNNNENEEKIGIKSKFKIPLIVIGVLLIVVLTIGIYKFFQVKDARSLYTSILNDFESKLVSNLNIKDDAKIYSISGNLLINIDSNDSEINSIGEILNNLKINYEVQMDLNKKLENVLLSTTYDNKNLLDLGLYLKEDTMYVDLGDLYNKNIKYSDEELKEVWEVIDTNDYETIIKEFNKIIQDNLKEEYFKEESGKTKVNGNDINTKSYILEIKGTEVYNFENNIINSIEENDNLIVLLSKTGGMTESDVVTYLDNAREELVENEDAIIRLEIHAKGFMEETAKVLVNIDNEVIEFHQNKKDTYNIIYNDEEIGSLVNKKNNKEVNINQDGNTFTYEYDGKLCTIEFKDNNARVYLNIENNEKINFMLGVNEDDTSIEIVLDGVISDAISEVSSKDNEEYVDYNNLTEEDMETIYNNLYNNEALLSLIEDLSQTSLLQNLMLF